MSDKLSNLGKSFIYLKMDKSVTMKRKLDLTVAIFNFCKF